MKFWSCSSIINPTIFTQNIERNNSDVEGRLMRVVHGAGGKVSGSCYLLFQWLKFVTS